MKSITTELKRVPAKPMSEEERQTILAAVRKFEKKIGMTIEELTEKVNRTDA
jgi:hypothetical protein